MLELFEEMFNEYQEFVTEAERLIMDNIRLKIRNGYTFYVIPDKIGFIYTIEDLEGNFQILNNELIEKYGI